MNKSAGVDGMQSVESQLGISPSYHDAEIVELCLRTTGTSTLIVDIEKAHPDSKKAQELLICFDLDDVTDLELVDFSSQNVIGGIAFESDDETMTIRLAPIFGLTGWISAKHVKVRCVSRNSRDRIVK